MMLIVFNGSHGNPIEAPSIIHTSPIIFIINKIRFCNLLFLNYTGGNSRSGGDWKSPRPPPRRDYRHHPYGGGGGGGGHEGYYY